MPCLLNLTKFHVLACRGGRGNVLRPFSQCVFLLCKFSLDSSVCKPFWSGYFTCFGPKGEPSDRTFRVFRAMADEGEGLRTSRAEEVGILEQVKLNFRCKSVWEELSGSVGDLGTFLPIVLALTLVNGLDLGTTLLFTGAYNVATGNKCFVCSSPCLLKAASLTNLITKICGRKDHAYHIIWSRNFLNPKLQTLNSPCTVVRHFVRVVDD